MTESEDVVRERTDVSFEEIFESLPDPVAVCDDEGNVLVMNGQARVYLGVEPGAVVKLDLRGRETVRQIRMHHNATSSEFFLADVAVTGSRRNRLSASFHPIEPGTNYRVLFSSGPDGRVQSPNVRMMESLVNVGRHLELFKSPQKALALFAASFADVFPMYSFRILLGDGSQHDHAGWDGAEASGPASPGNTESSERDVRGADLVFEGAGRGWRVAVRNSGYVQIEREEDAKFSVSERQAFETFAQQLGLSVPQNETSAIGAVGPIIDQIDAIVVVCDSRRRVLVTNRTFERLAGTRDVVGRDILHFFDEPVAASIRTAAASVMAGGESEAFEAHLGDEESRVGLRIQIAATGGRDADASGFVLTGQQGELSIVELEERMTRAEQLMNLGQLATGVAHELKNPLTSILNYAEYLLGKYQDSFFEERDSERLRRIIEGVERIDSFVKDLMVLARPGDVHAAPVPLHGVIHESVLMCEVALRQSGASLELDLADESPLVHGHRNQLKQIVVNLVANAARAMGEPGGTIRVVTSVDASSVCCVVQDDAGGMSDETLQRIFEPFFTTREGRGGSGLGLALVRTIVRRHGGDIKVDSEVGRGTIFTITLPLAES